MTTEVHPQHSTHINHWTVFFRLIYANTWRWAILLMIIHRIIDVTNTTLFNSIFLGENSAIEVSEKFWWFFFSNFLLLLLCFIQLQISDVLLVNHRIQCLMVTCAENTHTWMLCDQFFFLFEMFSLHFEVLFAIDFEGTRNKLLHYDRWSSMSDRGKDTGNLSKCLHLM